MATEWGENVTRLRRYNAKHNLRGISVGAENVYPQDRCRIVATFS